MKIIAVNGSPRKSWNTAALLKKALEGAESAGGETELVHLYDLSYKGCVSCFACKTMGGRSYGKCAFRDGLTPYLERLGQADAIILGSPIYYGTVTGEMRSFMERLFFPYGTYTDPLGTLFPRAISTGFIYTMGATEELAKERGFHHHINHNEVVMSTLFGRCESLVSYDTYQFEDYSKIYAPRFSEEAKAKRRAEVFPLDLDKAFEMGRRFAGKPL